MRMYRWQKSDLLALITYTHDGSVNITCHMYAYLSATTSISGRRRMGKADDASDGRESWSMLSRDKSAVYVHISYYRYYILLLRSNLVDN